MSAPRRHIVGGEIVQGQNNTIVIEDPTVKEGTFRVECAVSEIELAMQLKLMCPDAQIKRVKGFPRQLLHMYVNPRDWDHVVEMFNDDEVKPLTDQEVANEILKNQGKLN